MEQFPELYSSPGQVKGLRMAETAQLSLDYHASPEAFETVSLFCGKYVDERESLTERLNKHQELMKKLSINEQGYTFLKEQFSLQGAAIGEVIGVARGSAGAYMLDLRREARDSLGEFLATADDFSVLLAEFCQERLEEEPLIIMGREFDYKLGFLALRDREYPTSNGFVNIVYGSNERFIELRQALVVNRTSKEMENVKYGHADAGKWASLLNNLELLTRF